MIELQLTHLLVHLYFIVGNNPTEENKDLTHFDLSVVVLATDNFALCNKIGAGGFGDVYKVSFSLNAFSSGHCRGLIHIVKTQGVLRDEQPVAIHKISFQSGESISEFRTEVKLIAKFQHRNLVKLLGCCTKAGETLLVYEYGPKKSLDLFIFGTIIKLRPAK